MTIGTTKRYAICQFQHYFRNSVYLRSNTFRDIICHFVRHRGRTLRKAGTLRRGHSRYTTASVLYGSRRKTRKSERSRDARQGATVCKRLSTPLSAGTFSETHLLSFEWGASYYLFHSYFLSGTRCVVNGYKSAQASSGSVIFIASPWIKKVESATSSSASSSTSPTVSNCFSLFHCILYDTVLFLSTYNHPPCFLLLSSYLSTSRRTESSRRTTIFLPW